MRSLTIFDTTLRDGDQAAGFAFFRRQKVQLAVLLGEAGVDAVEAGFPLSSRTEFDTCRDIVAALHGTQTAAALMCRAKREEIAQTAALLGGNGILHLTLPVSDAHRVSLLGISRSELLKRVTETVGYASGLTERIEMGAEDASRADIDFLCEYIVTAIDAGAATINIADTLGILCPPATRSLIGTLKQRIDPFASGKTALSIHCHNDYGLAAANTLAAIEAGCHQAEVTVCGIGERAGNAPLEEVAVNLFARPDHYSVSTNLKQERLAELVRKFSCAAVLSSGPLKPFFGWNTNAHASGIHQKGLETSPHEYSSSALQAAFQECAGRPRRIVLSRHSGKAGIRLAASFCGIDNIDGKAVETILQRLKDDEHQTLGITEFLVWLKESGLFPADTAAPVTCNEIQVMQTDSAVEVEAVLSNQTRITGSGSSLEFAVLSALQSVTEIGLALRFAAVEWTGLGGQYRLYAETVLPDREILAAERTGKVPGRLLLEIGLDAVNFYRTKNKQTR
ncbi:MAG: hypothetical protein LBT46_06740 [Planctomycetaceae bacterium]|nr:hypothetical protein [Planctomycetaceae bacterium]